MLVFVIDVSPEAIASGQTIASMRAMSKTISALRERHTETRERARILAPQWERDRHNMHYNTSSNSSGDTGSTGTSFLSFLWGKGSANSTSSGSTGVPSSSAGIAMSSGDPDLCAPSCRVGIVTFSDAITFYEVSLSLSLSVSVPEPVRALVVDPADPFAPLPPHRWLLDVCKDAHCLDVLLSRLPDIVMQGRTGLSPSQCLAVSPSPALCPSAAVRAVQLSLSSPSTSPIGGRVMVFTHSHSTKGYGSLSFDRRALADYGSTDELLLYSSPSEASLSLIAQSKGGTSNSPSNGSASNGSASNGLRRVSSVGSMKPPPTSNITTNSGLSSIGPPPLSSQQQTSLTPPPSGGSNNTYIPPPSPSRVINKPLSRIEMLDEIQSNRAECVAMSAECAAAGVSVTVYAFTDAHLGLSPLDYSYGVGVGVGGVALGEREREYFDPCYLGDICMRTGGRLVQFKGSLYLEDSIGRLQTQVLTDALSIVGGETQWKVRASGGLAVDSVLGPGGAAMYDRVAESPVMCASVDEHTTFTFALTYGGTNTTSPGATSLSSGVLKEDDRVHLQVAVLYTAWHAPLRKALRRVRVHNLSLTATAKPAVVFRNCDTEAVLGYFVKHALTVALDSSLGSPAASSDSSNSGGPKARLQSALVETLLKYRRLCSASSPKGQLVLPESLKVLPVYTLGALKHTALIENSPGGTGQGSLSPNAVPGAMVNNMIGSSSVNPANLSLSSPRARARLAAMHSPSSHQPLSSATERGTEIRKLLSLSLKEVINAVYPRMYNLFNIIEDDLLVSSDEREREDTLSNGSSVGLSLSHSTSRPSSLTSAIAPINPTTGAPNTSSSITLTPSGPSPSSTAALGLPPMAAMSLSLSQTHITPSTSQNSLSSSQLLGGPGGLSLALSPAATRTLKQRHVLVQTLHCTSEVFESDQIYVLDDRSTIWFYIGRSVPQDLLEELFTLPSHSPYDRPEVIAVRETSPLGQKVATFMKLLMIDSPCKQGKYVIIYLL